MSGRGERDGQYVKNAAGVWVPEEPISASLVAAAATNDIPRVKSDDTLEFATLTAGSNVTITHGSGTITIASTASGGGGGLASPDDPPGSPNTEDDEFNSSTLNGKWTESLSGAPSVDIDTTWASRYFADFTGEQSAQLTQVYAPTGDFSLTAKFHIPFGTSGQLADIGALDAGENNGMYVQCAAATPGVILLSEDTNAFTIRATDTITLNTFSAIYLHLQRVGTSWTAWHSHDGWAFNRVGSHTKSLTVAKFFVRVLNPASPPARMGIDWVRRDWVTL